jgi:hypothetical protein
MIKVSFTFTDVITEGELKAIYRDCVSVLP